MGLIGGGWPTPPKDEAGLIQPWPLTAYLPQLTDKGGVSLRSSDACFECPAEVKAAIHDVSFSREEKKDIEEVLDKMKALMSCQQQPVKHIGRCNQGITGVANGARVESTTMGEWLADRSTAVLTDAAVRPVDFADGRTQFKATLVHELTHGLTNGFDPRTCQPYENWKDNPLMQEWGKAAGWNRALSSLKDDSRAPNDYAKTNPREDLSESVAFFFYAPEQLKAKSPERHEFIQKLLGDKK